VQYPQYLKNSLLRYLNPLGDNPPIGSYRIKVNPDNGTKFLAGDSLSVMVENLSYKEDNLPEMNIVWSEGRIAPQKFSSKYGSAMIKKDEKNFTYTFKKIKSNFAFRIIFGDTLSKYRN
ncbi:MAG: hypothetical protein ACYTFY_22965, partial [Planctomycetota bacterium]